MGCSDKVYTISYYTIRRLIANQISQKSNKLRERLHTWTGRIQRPWTRSTNCS